jgi:predicted secreted protein
VARIAALLLLACLACHHDDPPAQPPPVTTSADDAAAETVVRVEDDGKTFEVARGATLVFKLVTHGGTGFAWMPAPLDGGTLAQQGDRTTELASDVPGSPRTDVYRFVAQTPGTTTIAMELERPWGDAPPAKTLRVTVNVH